MSRKVTQQLGSIHRKFHAWKGLALGAIAALAVTLPASAQSFCEPLAGTVIFCGCGNHPSGPGRGCDNSNATGGAALTVAGVASISNDTLVVTTTGIGSTGPLCSGPTGNVSCVLVQGDTLITPMPFFDGVRCVGGNLLRIQQNVFSVGGTFVSSVGISATSLSLGDPLSAGSIRYYFLYYRDSCPTYACLGPLDLANVSNAYQVTWVP